MSRWISTGYERRVGTCVSRVHEVVMCSARLYVDQLVIVVVKRGLRHRRQLTGPRRHHVGLFQRRIVVAVLGELDGLDWLLVVWRLRRLPASVVVQCQVFVDCRRVEGQRGRLARVARRQVGQCVGAAVVVASGHARHRASQHVRVLRVGRLHHPRVLLPVLLPQQLADAADTGRAGPGATARAADTVYGLAGTCRRLQQSAAVLFSPSQLLLSLLFTLALRVLHQSTATLQYRHSDERNRPHSDAMMLSRFTHYRRSVTDRPTELRQHIALLRTGANVYVDSFNRF